MIIILHNIQKLQIKVLNLLKYMYYYRIIIIIIFIEKILYIKTIIYIFDDEKQEQKIDINLKNRTLF